MNLIQKIGAPYSVRISDALAAPFTISSRTLAFTLMFLCLGMNVYIRLFPSDLPGLRREAALNVANAEAVKNFPYHEGGLIRGKGSETLSGMKEQKLSRDDLDGKIRTEFLKLKDPYQDESGGTYLLETDPYAWAAWTRNILQYGHPGDQLVKKESYDSTMLAPNGAKVFHFKLLFYLTAFLYQAVSLFTCALSLNRFLFLIPVFYSACFLLALYLFIRRGSSDLTAFLAVALWGCMREAVSRGSAGWYDFDMLSLLMALAVAWCLIEGLRGDSWPRLVFFSLAAAFFEGLYAMTWLGWWFMLIVAAGFFVLSIAARIGFGPMRVRETLGRIFRCVISAALFFIFSFILARIFAGVDILARVGWLKGFLRFGTAESPDIWPNVFFTISELGGLTLRGIAAHCYGPWIFTAVLCSVAIVLWKEWRTERRDRVLMLFCWFLFMLFASLKSNRFVVYMAVPAFIFLAMVLVEYMPDFIVKRWTGIKRVLGVMACVALIALLVNVAFQSGIARGEQLRPDMNDAWHKALTHLDRGSPKGSIINAWWDFGSWFRYYGGRRVIFDGQSQNGQLAHWMAKVLLENDEAAALRILRMLDNSGGALFRQMSDRIQDPFFCKSLLDELLAADRERAAVLLAAHGFGAKDAEKILRKLFDRPPPAYFVVDASLLRKMSNISFLGNWDFRRLLIDRERRKPREEVISRLTSLFGISPDEAKKIYGWQTEFLENTDRNEMLSRRFDFAARSVRGEKGLDLVRFANGIVWNTATGEVLYHAAKNAKFRIPGRTVIWRDGIRSEVRNEKGEKGQGVLVVVRGEEYQAFWASDVLLDSLFVRLFFLRGDGLKHFRPFYLDEENGIYLYEILWDAV